MLYEVITGGFATEDETLAAIKEVWRNYHYLMDTHTAVAYSVGKKQKTGKNKKLILSTANPYKFPDSVLYALGEKVSSDGFENINMLEDITGVKAPDSISSLKDAEILHKESVNISEMKDALDRIISK